MTDILERLQEVATCADYEVDREIAAKAKAEIEKLREENGRFRAALEPFAKFCEEMDALPHCAAKPDEAVIHWPLTVGAFRAARAAREEK